MKTYQEALLEYQGQRIPYAVLLSLKEWKAKRTKIERRENNTCEICRTACVDDYFPFVVGSIEINKPASYKEVEVEYDITDPYTGEVIDSYLTPQIQLVVQEDPHFSHVHHTYYVLGKLPWEYPDDALILVCHKCHKEIHKKEVTKVYRGDSLKEFIELASCNKCEGTGYLPEFDYHKNGVCFDCDGVGYKELY